VSEQVVENIIDKDKFQWHQIVYGLFDGKEIVEFKILRKGAPNHYYVTSCGILSHIHEDLLFAEKPDIEGDRK
jgi:hypothetical protein